MYLVLCIKKDRIKNNPKEAALLRVQKAQERAQLLYDRCPNDLIEEKLFFKNLCKSYESYSLENNFSRMRLFFKYRREILMYKKHNAFRRLLYCIKIFFKIV